jgi:DNA-binding MarR family transcriptional regulator
MKDAAGVTPDEWEMWRSFRTMHRQLEATLERQLQRDADISGADYGVLLTLFEASGRQLRPSELGERLMWEKSRVSHQVSRMQKRGLVERRECDEDARGTWVGLTPDGTRAVLGSMREHANSLRKYFFDVLDPEQLDALRQASDRVASAIGPVDCDPDAEQAAP